MKCGTSSLHYYLDLHPEVRMSRQKELNFFIAAEDQRDPQSGEALGHDRLRLAAPARERGEDWYRAQLVSSAPVSGETSVAYTYPWYPEVASRIRALSPQARLVMLVRDPIERMLSQFAQFADREPDPPEATFERAGNVYLELSRYGTCLKPFLEQFPRSQIHLVRQDELDAKPRETLRELFRFAGVDPGFWTSAMEVRRNLSRRPTARVRLAKRLRSSRAARPLRELPVSARAQIEKLVAGSDQAAHPSLSAGVVERLRSRLEPEILEVERVTGWDLDAWRG